MATSVYLVLNHHRVSDSPLAVDRDDVGLVGDLRVELPGVRDHERRNRRQGQAVGRHGIGVAPQERMRRAAGSSRQGQLGEPEWLPDRQACSHFTQSGHSVTNEIVLVAIADPDVDRLANE